MPDIATHALAANGLLFAGQILDIPEAGVASAGVAFMIGSVFPDIGTAGYLYVDRYRKRSGRGPGANPKLWKKQVFAFLDKQTYWGCGYKFTHSVLCVLFALLPLMYLLFGPLIAIAYTLGHLLHLAMDYPLHEESWIVWPLKREPKVVSTPEWNWWNALPWVRDYSFTINVAGISANVALSYVLIFGLPH